MYQHLGKVTLKSGEVVDCAAVRGPDEQWLPRITHLLQHKPAPYDWQIQQILAKDTGLDITFYILHRGDIAFSNVLTVTQNGVGLLGHVYTVPDDRRKHATSLLMKHQMEHFRQGGGRALYLGTGYDTPPYHIYIEHGFLGVEERSGVMAYHTTSEHEFEKTFFSPAGIDETILEPVDWAHYALSTPLTVGDWPEVMRLAAHQLVGRSISEGPLLAMIRANRARGSASPSAWALRHLKTGAVLGLASWTWDPIWPWTAVVDVFCHPDHWARAPELLAKIVPPDDARQVAYIDEKSAPKRSAMEAAGFKRLAVLPAFATDYRPRTPRIAARLFTRG